MVRDQMRAKVSKPVAMRNTGTGARRVFDDYDVTVQAAKSDRNSDNRSVNP